MVVTDSAECVKGASTGIRVVQLLKENRIEDHDRDWETNR